MNEYKSKHAHKPPKNHPWRRSPQPKITTWAKEQSALGKEQTFRIGQLKK